MAIDVLYRRVDGHETIRGLTLSTTENAEEIRIAGYADGTSLYQADEAVL